MKKGKLALLLPVAALALTGCGSSKTLTCTKTETSEGMETKAAVEIKFKKDTVEAMNLTIDLKLPEEYKDQKKELMDTYKNMMSGVDVKETKDGIQITADSDSEYFDSFDIDKGKAKYEDAKKAFEDQGFKCK